MHANAFIAMGTNMPFAGVSGVELLRAALAAMSGAALRVSAKSSVWRTPAWPPGADQPDYFNAVVEVIDPPAPEVLYASLRAIEQSFGRERRTRWEPRTLDLDIVAMSGWSGRFGDLMLPHERMHERSFVLAPLAEIAPGWVHPASGRSVRELLAALPAGEGYRRVDDLA